MEHETPHYKIESPDGCLNMSDGENIPVSPELQQTIREEELIEANEQLQEDLSNLREKYIKCNDQRERFEKKLADLNLYKQKLRELQLKYNRMINSNKYYKRLIRIKELVSGINLEVVEVEEE